MPLLASLPPKRTQTRFPIPDWLQAGVLLLLLFQNALDRDAINRLHVETVTGSAPNSVTTYDYDYDYRTRRITRDEREADSGTLAHILYTIRGSTPQANRNTPGLSATKALSWLRAQLSTTSS